MECFYTGASTCNQSVVRNLVWVCNREIFNNTKTLESVDLLPLFTDDRKVFTVKVKANIAGF